MAKRHSRKNRRSRKSRDWGVVFLVLILGGALLVRFVSYITERSLWPALLWLGALVLLVGSGYLAFRLYILLKRIRARSQTFRPFYSAGIDTLVSMDPFEFEKFIGHMYERKGYLVRLTPERGDQGIDLVLYKDRKRYAVQIKKYAPGHPVSVHEVRDFYGSFANAGYAGGFFITTSGYTRSITNWVGTRPITLIDGVELLFQLSGAAELPWYRLILSRVLRAPEVLAPPAELKTPAEKPAYTQFWKNL